MKRLIFCLAVLVAVPSLLSAQLVTAKFGKGIQLMGKDSSYAMKLGIRFQNLFYSEWDFVDDKKLDNHDAGFLVRRSRLKFNGWANKPRLGYKLELALSNRDLSGGNSGQFGNTANLVLDAFVTWNFYKNLSIVFGQGKLPGNRERLISSGNLQFVDRSRLNSRYTTDRDVGIQLKNHNTLGENFVVREVFAFTQGEGRNVINGFSGGFAYAAKIELLPFGEFQSKGDYVGSAVKLEETPKLAIAAAYDFNNNSIRERGQKGSFIDNAYGKNLHTVFADLMFKYKRVSAMAEFAKKTTGDGEYYTLDELGGVQGEYYTGLGANLQAGYMFKKNYELAARWTGIFPEEGVANKENQYTLGFSKFVIGHKLKAQFDLTYRKITDSDDGLLFRSQVEIHF